MMHSQLTKQMPLQYNLGLCYAHGTGVENDEKNAVESQPIRAMPMPRARLVLNARNKSGEGREESRETLDPRSQSGDVDAPPGAMREE